MGNVFDVLRWSIREQARFGSSLFARALLRSMLDLSTTAGRPLQDLRCRQRDLSDSGALLRALEPVVWGEDVQANWRAHVQTLSVVADTGGLTRGPGNHTADFRTSTAITNAEPSAATRLVAASSLQCLRSVFLYAKDVASPATCIVDSIELGLLLPLVGAYRQLANDAVPVRTLPGFRGASSRGGLPCRLPLALTKRGAPAWIFQKSPWSESADQVEPLQGAVSRLVDAVQRWTEDIASHAPDASEDVEAAAWRMTLDCGVYLRVVRSGVIPVREEPHPWPPGARD
jgi:hypothetical protein